MAEAKQQRPLDIELAARHLTLDMLSKDKLCSAYEKITGSAPRSALGTKEKLCDAIVKSSKDTAADAAAIVEIYEKDQKRKKHSIKESNRVHALDEKVHWYEHDTAMEAARQRLCKKLPTDSKTLPLLVEKMAFEFEEPLEASCSYYDQGDTKQWSGAKCARCTVELGREMSRPHVAVFSDVAWNEKKQVIEVKFDREYTFGSARKITTLHITPYISNAQQTWALREWDWLDFSAEAESTDGKSSCRMQCLYSWTEQWTPAKDLRPFHRPQQMATGGGAATGYAAWVNPAYRAPAVKRSHSEEEDSDDVDVKHARSS